MRSAPGRGPPPTPPPSPPPPRPPPPPPSRRPRPGSRSAAAPRARSRRAALGLSRPASGRPAGAAPVSFEDDQDLALLDDLTLLHADLLDGPRARCGHRDLHLHRLEDEQLVLLPDMCARLRLDLPDAADKLGFHFRHLVSK